MKKIFYISLALIASAAVSCVKEDMTDNDTPVVEGKTLILEAVAPADVTANPLGTKTEMAPNGDNYSVLWSENDAISVNGVTSSKIEIAADNAKSATFTVSGIEAPCCAVYPAAVASDFEAASALVTLPATQKYTAGSFDPAAAVMLGYMEEEGTLSFSHAMAYLYLTISTVDDYDNDNIKTVTVKSLGTEPMSGKFTATFDAEGCTMAPAEGTASTEVTLDCGAEGVAKGTPVVIALPAGTYSGISITVTDVNGHTKTLQNTWSHELAAGHVYTTTLRVAAPGIYNVAGYNAFAAAVNAGDYSAWVNPEDGEVNLYADITSDVNYTYISNFAGTFDGNGHTITCTEKNSPLFNTLAKTAVVKNLTTAGTYKGFSNQGEQAFASFARVNLGTIQDCANTTSGDLSTTASIAFGGFVGQNGGTIQDCTNEGDILLTVRAAGLVCYGGGFAAYGHTSDKSAAGKFVNCENKGDVKVTVENKGTILRTGFGGICGVVICNGVIFDGCTNSGIVARIDSDADNNTCASSVGGILGRSAIHHSSSNPFWLDMDGNSGKFNTKFTGCTNMGEVINSVKNGHNFKSQSSDELGNKKVGTGGIVGALVSNSSDPAVFTRCKNTGPIKAGFNATNNSHVAGGLAGMVRNATFIDCESTGSISVYGDGNICGPMGGFVGFALAGVNISGGTAKPSITLKTVSSPSLYSYGLLVGTARATFSASNVYAGGSIKVNGTEKVTSINFADYLCFNKHFTVTPTFTNCNWAE